MSTGGRQLSAVPGDTGRSLRVRPPSPRPPRHPTVRLGQRLRPGCVDHRTRDAPRRVIEDLGRAQDGVLLHSGRRVHGVS